MLCYNQLCCKDSNKGERLNVFTITNNNYYLYAWKKSDERKMCVDLFLILGFVGKTLLKTVIINSDFTRFT